MGRQKIRIVLVDDEQRAINRLKILLNDFKEVEIIACYEQPKDALQGILNMQPDLVLLDVEMAAISGLEIAEEINRNNLSTQIVFVSGHEHYAIKAIKTQAFDYLLKPVDIDELKQTLYRFQAQHLSNLSKREIEIIKLLAKGLNSKQVGEELHLSRHTIDTYRRKILEKTNCKNTAELIQYALRTGIVQ